QQLRPRDHAPLLGGNNPHIAPHEAPPSRRRQGGAGPLRRGCGAAPVWGASPLRGYDAVRCSQEPCMPPRFSYREGIAALAVTLGAGACANVVGLTALHDGICDPGSTQECPYTGPTGTKDQGICKAGTQTCASDGQSWGACYGEVLPKPAQDCTA